MKIILSLFFLFFFLTLYSQDSAKIKEIDSIVARINTSEIPAIRDSIFQDYPEIGLKMTTYLTMIVNGNQLMKYVNYVNGSGIENGMVRQTTGSNTFYYNKNRLIKVEEFLIEGGKNEKADWYYSEDKPLYFTLQSDKAEERAFLLLTMSKAMLNQIIKSKSN